MIGLDSYGNIIKIRIIKEIISRFIIFIYELINQKEFRILKTRKTFYWSEIFRSFQINSIFNKFLFKIKVNNKAEEKDELFTAPRKNSDLSKPVKKSESPKPKKKTPLFSSSTDDDNSDLFQTIKKVEPTKKVEKPQKKATSLFEDSSEEIFTETKTVSNVEEKKTSLFDDSSDELFADNNNGEDKKLKQEPENNPNKLDQPRKSIVKKDLLFNPAALANSSIFKKMADKNEDKIVSDPLEKIDSSEQVSNDDVLQKPIENAKIEEKVFKLLPIKRPEFVTG